MSTRTVRTSDFFEQAGYTVKWIDGDTGIRVFDATYGCSIIISPKNVDNISGKTYITPEYAAYCLGVLKTCNMVLPGYPGKLKPPLPPPVVVVPVSEISPVSSQPKPRWMSTHDWDRCLYYAAEHKIFPLILAAIGWHETEWGAKGAGRSGYHLGVGVPSSGAKKTQYQGLDAQLNWASHRLGNKVVCGEPKTAYQRASGGNKTLPPVDYNPSLYNLTEFAGWAYVPDDPVSWAKGVFRIYKDLGGDQGADTPPPAAPVAGGKEKVGEIPVLAANTDLVIDSRNELKGMMGLFAGGVLLINNFIKSLRL